MHLGVQHSPWWLIRSIFNLSLVTAKLSCVVQCANGSSERGRCPDAYRHAQEPVTAARIIFVGQLVD